MSRYSPTVSVQPLLLGDAINAGLDRFLQARQLREQRDIEAAQTGVGVTWPTQENTPNAPVSIMATAAPVQNTQTPASAPLPGVAGMASPGRIQSMNLPGDLGPALQTGQQRQINGVAQPHDDLRAAIANVGKQVTDGQTPIMSLASQSYTPPMQSSGFDPNMMVTLPSGRQMPLRFTGFGRPEALLSDRAGLQYGLQDVKGAQRAQQIGLTTQGRLAAIDANGQWRDLYTNELIDSRLIMKQMGDDTSILDHDTPSGSTIYRVDHPTSSGTISQSNYLLKRVPQLMKPTRGPGGIMQPGLSMADAQRQATAEYGSAVGSDGGSSGDNAATSSGTPSGITLGTPQTPSKAATSSRGLSPSQLAAHQKIDAHAAQAIANGADPQQVAERANLLHSQVGAQ